VEVQLIDTVGLTEAVLPVPATLGGPFQRGIELVPGQPHDLIVPWLGGDCDHRTTLTLHREAGVLIMSVRSTGGPPPGVLCTLGGRLSAVVVRFIGDAPPLTLDAP
jgi:hypothetical protein